MRRFEHRYIRLLPKTVLRHLVWCTNTKPQIYPRTSRYPSHLRPIELDGGNVVPYSPLLLRAMTAMACLFALSNAPRPSSTALTQTGFFAPHAISPSQGHWHLGFPTNGPYHTTDLWMVGEKWIHPVPEEEFVFSGTFTAYRGHGFISEFIINTLQFRRWTLPGRTSFVHITSVHGQLVTFKTASGLYTVDLATGQMQPR